MHYFRHRKYGDPTAGDTFLGDPMRFLMSLVGHEGAECIIWPYGKRPNGYGQIWHADHMMVASRWMCTIAHGPPPSEAHQAAHGCGKGRQGCVNPNHLRWATPTENAADKIAHGSSVRGEASPTARLTEADVRTIRSEHKRRISGARLARRYGVTKETVYAVVHRRTWNWLDG